MEENEKSRARYIKMTQTPIPKLISVLAIPTIISMLTTSFYNMADTFFVSKLGTSAMGAVGIIFSIMALIQAVGFTFGVGSGSYVSRLMGAKQPEKANEVASTAIFAAFVVGLLMTVFGLLFLDDLVRLLGATETIAPYARDYAGIILLGAPIMTTQFVMNNNLRSEGSAGLSMVGIATGAVLNIILDPLLIFTFGMGIKGAAIATVFSQLVSFCILGSHFITGRSNLRLSARKISRDPKVYGEILKIGSPSLFRQGLASFAGILLNVAGSGFGDAVIAGMSAVNRIMMFIQSVLMGFGQGFQPVAGFSWGSKNYKRLLDGYKFCLKVALIVMAVAGALGFFFAPAVIGIFSKHDAQVLSVGTLAMRLACIVVPLQAYTIITNMLFQSIGKAKSAAILALSRQGLCFIPLILILPQFLGVFGIQMSQPLADLGTFLISFPMSIMAIKEIKGLIKKQEQDGTEPKNDDYSDIMKNIPEAVDD